MNASIMKAAMPSIPDPKKAKRYQRPLTLILMSFFKRELTPLVPLDLYVISIAAIEGPKPAMNVDPPKPTFRMPRLRRANGIVKVQDIKKVRPKNAISSLSNLLCWVMCCRTFDYLLKLLKKASKSLNIDAIYT